MRPTNTSSNSLPVSARTPHFRFLALLTALAACPLFGQQPPPDYRLDTGDRLSVTVLEVPELGFTSPVDGAGAISLPDEMGIVRVSGMTVAQAQRAIEERMERTLRSASVRIVVDQTRSSTVRLRGAVKKPGDHDIGPNTTLFELLTRGDEVTDAHAGVVTVRRTSTTGLVEQVELPLSVLLQELEPRYNLPLRNGDLITIPAGEEMTVYFVGEVNASISFESSEPKTLARAVAKAGGLTERSSGKLVINRTLSDGSKRIINAKYKRILDGRDPDIALERGDLILVKRSVI